MYKALWFGKLQNYAPIGPLFESSENFALCHYCFGSILSLPKESELEPSPWQHNEDDSKRRERERERVQWYGSGKALLLVLILVSRAK